MPCSRKGAGGPQAQLYLPGIIGIRIQHSPHTLIVGGGRGPEHHAQREGPLQSVEGQVTHNILCPHPLSSRLVALLQHPSYIVKPKPRVNTTLSPTTSDKKYYVRSLCQLLSGRR